MTHATTGSVQDAIAAANESFEAAFARQDAAGLAALYTQEAQVLPANSEAIIGRDAIEGFWQAVFGLGISGAQLHTNELDEGGDSAVEIGSYGLSGADGQTLDRGTYLVVWKQDRGQWRLHRDMFHSTQPAA